MARPAQPKSKKVEGFAAFASDSLESKVTSGGFSFFASSRRTYRVPRHCKASDPPAACQFARLGLRILDVLHAPEYHLTEGRSSARTPRFERGGLDGCNDHSRICVGEPGKSKSTCDHLQRRMRNGLRPEKESAWQ